LAARKGLDASRLLEELRLFPLMAAERASYLPFEEEARRRMASRDPDDWPTVALALALGLPIWSQDKDLEESGVRVYTTGRLLDALRQETEANRHE
jgi:predicted nucleic acid-binding protein